ncbi:hypothetical protein T4B_1632, partial [Trichinella pseudospiralis]
LLMSMTTFCSSDSLFIDHHFNTDLMTHIGTQDRKLRAVIKKYTEFVNGTGSNKINEQ